MSTTRFRFCLTAASLLHADDLDAVTAKIEAYRAAGMGDEMSERAAVDDVIAQGEGEFGDIGKLLREQHPDLFMASNEAPDAATPAAPAPDADAAFEARRTEFRDRLRAYWDGTATPAIRAYLNAFDAFGVDRLERNRIKPAGMTPRQWLESFVARQPTWDHGRKTGQTGIQYLSIKDLWPTDDGAGERLRKAALEAVKALKNAPGSTGELVAEAFREAMPEAPANVSTSAPESNTSAGPVQKPAESEQVAPAAITPSQAANMQRGDIVRDSGGTEFYAWSARFGRIDVMPLKDGKPVVNNASAIRFALDDTTKAANPEYRTDPLYLVRNAPAEEAADSRDDPPQLTEAQARKQFEWRNLGQKDGTKTHGLFFYVTPEDKGTGRAMGRGTVEMYQGSSGWKVDGEGQSYKALADAKAAAIEAAIPVLRDQGWIAPAAAAAGPKIGDMVKLTKPGLQGPVNIAGRDRAQGQYSIRQEADGRWQIMEGERETQSPASWFADRTEAQRAADARNGFEARSGTTQPGFDISPAMKEKAAGGMPMFSIARRNLLLGAAAAAATNAEAGTTLGKAKPIPAALLTADLPDNIQKLLRGNGATTLRGAEVIGQALREMAATGPTELRALASQIAGLLPTSGVMLTVDDRRTVNAHGAVSHNVGGPHMMLFTAGGRKGLTAGTFLHEALHVAVLARYKSLSSGLARSNDALFKMTAPQAAAQLEQFRALWREFGTMAKESISKVTDPALRLSIEEAHDSPDEFFVRALTDEKLQAWMAGVEYEGKSLLQRFKDWVVGLFIKDGVRPSWLDAALLASNDLAAAMPADKADFARMRASAALREEGAANKSTMPGKATETLAFRQWFGDSKIVDEAGQPRTMYHGTGQDITAFRPKQAGAIFLTDEPYFAEQYANTSTKWMEHRGEDGAANILPLYVKAENPFDYENPAQVQAVIAKALELHGRPLGDGQMAIFDPEFKTQTLSSATVLEYGMLAGDNWSLLESQHIQDAIKALGHDAFYVNEGGFKNLGVYKASQVKSATGNRGTFDGSSADIWLQRVWHGTPHKVDKFSTDKIGSGEGAQAYGWGLYFASKKELADHYRRTLSEQAGTVDGAPVDAKNPLHIAAGSLRESKGDRAAAAADLRNSLTMLHLFPDGAGPIYTEAARLLESDAKIPAYKPTEGNLYAVEIPEDNEMLLWDRPLSEHPARVRDALAPFIARYTESQRQIMSGFSAADVEREIQISQRTITGQGIYEQAGYMEGGDRGASEYLLGLGVRGIKYLDGTSRAAGAGAHNYVIFSGDDTAILGDGLNDPDTFYSRIHTPEQLAALAKAGQRPARTMRQSIAAGWQNMTATLANRGEMGHEAIQNTLDQFHGIDRAVKRDVGDLDHNADPYITARLANGGVGSVMRALLLHGQAEWSANGQHLQKKDGTVGLLEILEPLKNELPDWFGWMAGNRAARLKREGRENNFTDDDIRELKGLAGTPERERLFKDVARQYAEFKRSVLDIGEAAGIIDATTRPVWDHADYIPFFRLVDKTEVTTAGGQVTKFAGLGRKGLAGQSSGIRQLTGGPGALNDPIENLLMGFSRIIDASLKNNALDKTLAALEGASSPAIERATYDMKPALVLKSGIKQQLLDAGTDPMLVDLIPDDAFDGIAKMWSIQAPTDKDVIRVMRDGKPVYFRVLDPLLLKAATSFVPFDMPGLGLMRLAKRVLTGAVTATPDFMIRNWVRDSLSVLGIARDRVMPWQSVQGVWKAAAETGGAEAMMFAGASFQGGNIGGHDPTTSARAIRRALRQKGLDASATDSFMRSLVDKPARAWDLYRKLGEAVENSNREAVYEATMGRSGNATSAAFEAKDLMDFSLRGSHPVYQVAADVLPFFNARVQGLYRLGRADPKRLAAYGAIVATLSVLLWAANSGEPWYERLEDWDKDGYWHFKVGGEHFRIPKPFEVGAIFGTIPERIARVTAGTDSATKFGHRLLAVLHDQLAFDPVPQLVRPAANVWANKDTFRDRPIENEADKDTLPHMRFSGTTSATMRTATRELADLGIDLSPKKLEYLMGGYLGTSGLYALGLSDMAVRAIEGYPPRPTMRTDELPVVRSFYQQDPARSTVFESDLYKLRDQADKAFKALRKEAKAAAQSGDTAGVQRLMKLHEKQIQAAPTLDAVAAALAKFNQQRDAIYADRTATPDQKRQALDRLQEQRNELTRRAMQSPGLQSLQ